MYTSPSYSWLSNPRIHTIHLLLKVEGGKAKAALITNAFERKKEIDTQKGYNN